MNMNRAEAALAVISLQSLNPPHIHQLRGSPSFRKSLLKSYVRLLKDPPPRILPLDLTESGCLNAIISGPGEQIESRTSPAY
jgi:hypothetical protein